MRKAKIVVACIALLASGINAQTAVLRWLHTLRPAAQHARRFDPRAIEAPIASMQMLDDPPDPKWMQQLTAWRVGDGAWLLHRHPPYRD